MASVTVVIPSHDRSHLLRRAILSALSADEVIVYDDCSLDDSVAVAESMNVRVILAEECCGSPSAAINYAIANATSDWLMVLADDDFLLPDAIAKVKQYLSESADLMYTDLYLCDDDGTIRGLWEYSDRPQQPDELVEFVRQHRMNPIPMLGPWRVDWLRENSLCFVKWPGTGVADDCRTFLEWARHDPRIVHIAEPLYAYRQHSGQLSHLDKSVYLEQLDAYLRGLE